MIAQLHPPRLVHNHIGRGYIHPQTAQRVVRKMDHGIQGVQPLHDHHISFFQFDLCTALHRAAGDKVIGGQTHFPSRKQIIQIPIQTWNIQAIRRFIIALPLFVHRHGVAVGRHIPIVHTQAIDIMPFAHEAAHQFFAQIMGCGGFSAARRTSQQHQLDIVFHNLIRQRYDLASIARLFFLDKFVLSQNGQPLNDSV